MPLFFKHQMGAQRLRMPWGVVGAIGGAVVNNVMADDGGGGGGQQQSSSSEPWKVAQPWMMQNILQGMQQQNQLTAQPFSPQQQAAYDNSYALNDYTRRLVPSLLGQLGGQQVGFDRKNPTARPEAWNWSGLLSENAPDLGQRSVLDARPPASAPAAAQDQPAGKFLQQEYATSGMNMTGQNPDGSLLGAGGYGSFKYGMPMPKAGTKEYRDMSEYFAMGGLDPNNHYGRGGEYKDPNANPLAYLWGGGGGANGGGGIGDTGANAAAAASGNTAW